MAAVVPAFSQTWTQTTAPVGNYWSSVASSADGTKVVAAAYISTGFQPGCVYLSMDSGQNWTTSNIPLEQWEYVASSRDGKILAATANYDQIYTSTNSGLTWRSNNVARKWGSICVSSNGTRMAVAPANYPISISTDSGVTWTTNGPTTNWNSIACSADGTKLVACGGLGDPGNLAFVFTSADSGSNWISRLPLTSTAGGGSAVASSADGTKLVFVTGMGRIFTSTDSGATWNSNNIPVAGGWWTVASSADGTKLVVAGAYSGGSPIYTSADSGTTWNPNTSAPLVWWNGVASSADGSKLYAGTWYGNGLYTLQTAAAAPMLGITFSGAQMVVSWPQSLTGWTLQTNANLALPVWGNYLGAIANNSTTNSTEEGSLFFRLVNP
ncbi:MAG: sialidase family protein [Verrucomicrobiota bacterium]